MIQRLSLRFRLAFAFVSVCIAGFVPFVSGASLTAEPTVSSVEARQLSGSKPVEVTYDLAMAGEETVPAAWIQAGSAHGAKVAPGTGKTIIRDAEGVGWEAELYPQAQVEATATSEAPAPAPEGFVLIPAGSFEMGDHFGEGSDWELPVHAVDVSDFYMGTTQVTKEQWDALRSWGMQRGYTDLSTGGGKGPDHPVHSVNWFDAVKWLNAWSEQDGLAPAYRVNGAVMKTGNDTPVIDYSANGYRLPTEAEWEKAARGGLSGQRFPWGDTISHDDANYSANGDAYSYDLSPYDGWTSHPDYNDGSMLYTSPVGSFSPNGYGLYDMAGNVFDWCNDMFSDTYYSGSPGVDPRGPSSGPYLVLRGGSWTATASRTRVSHREFSAPGDSYNTSGFRPARGSVGPADPTYILELFGNFDFGEENVGQSTTWQLMIANAGTMPLTVTGIDYPDGFSGDWSGGTIAAGGSREVAVTFSPTAEQDYGGTITVESDATSGVATIEASGTGVAGGPTLEGFVLIPAGSFEMGDHFGDGWSSEQPVHTVYVSDFLMGQFHVTKDEWDTLRSWAMNRGYTDLPTGGGKGPDHPVHTVNWFDAVKWLNAWSEKDGLEPVYRVSGGIYRSGERVPAIDYSADGYRLPTEAEWEKAARGGLSGQRFPWGDTISHEDANYRPHGGGHIYDVSSYLTLVFHPSFSEGMTPYTSPVDSFEPNGYGLYDMAGNVADWCNDSGDDSYYSVSPVVDPRGPPADSGRVKRGGNWNYQANYARVSSRIGNHPASRSQSTGFRPVRKSGGADGLTRIVDLFGDLDFGGEEMGTSTARQLWIINAGNEPLTVADIAYPDGFSGDWTGGAIDAESAREVTVTFSPATEQVYGGTITVESDATEGANTIPVNGTGVVATREILLSGNLDFGGVTAGYGKTRLLRIDNAGNEPLTVTDIAYPDGFSGDWSEGVIGPGRSREVIVSFSPVAEEGYGGTIEVDSDATSGVSTIEASGAGVADDAGLEGFVLIPSGSFEMGDQFGEGWSGELPVHTVEVSAFYMGRTQVTKGQWDAVKTWALDNGYRDFAGGGFKGPGQPVHYVSWLDAVKWLNAWSEKDGLAPVYRVNGMVMRSGNAVPTAQFSANGYRLPTEAEWEKAARGGLSGRRFPWGDTISHDNANYRAIGSTTSYDVSPYDKLTYHPAYITGGSVYVAPVGSFAPNGHGLYDMAGNVFEWCHDWYGDTYYSVSPGVDPRGPESGTLRALRGGNYNSDALRTRVSHRRGFAQEERTNGFGFRPVASADRAPTPVLELSDDLSFGDVTVGQISARILTITNTGNGPLTVTGIDLPDGFSADWTAGTVAIWESREVTVTFSPVAEQDYGGTITVESDAISDEATIEANGAGIAGGPPLEGFALIPAGKFEMGDHFGEGSSRELPVHTVNVSAFYMGRTQVTKDQWDEVRSWAANHGYTDLSAGGGKGPDHPVHTVNWFDAVKWLNAWSEMDGLEPVYRVNGTVMKTGNTTPVIDYAAGGYRLPTEAEWEKAARGGLSGQRFPWGDTITHNNANYRAFGRPYTYDLSPFVELTYHPAYNDGTLPYTSPVGSFPAYGYGLHDMTGNVWEWCNDWFSSTYYTVRTGRGDRHGPSSGLDRMLRGGGWNSSPIGARVSLRGADSPGSRSNSRGFRPVLPQTSVNEVTPPKSPEERIASIFDLEAAGTVIVGHPVVSPWFGKFTLASGFDMEENQGWLFHNQHGWLYWSGGGWFWRHSQQQWHYMTESIHPFAYVHEIGWFYFDEDSPAFPARQWFSSYREENGEQVPDTWVRWFHHAGDDVTAFRLEASDLAPGVELILTINEEGFEYILAFGEENEVTIPELGEEGSYRYEIIDATHSILDLVLFAEDDPRAALMEQIHLTFESANEGTYELTGDEEAEDGEDVVEEGRFLFR